MADILSNLVGWWKLDEGSGTSAFDSSGNGNTGTLTSSPTWVTGQIGPYAIHSAGVGYITCGNPASLQITGSLTMAAWIYLDDHGQASANITAKSLFPSGASYNLMLDDDPNNNLAILVSSNGTLYAIRYTNAQFPLTSWHHVAGVYDAPAQTLTLYMDGVVIPTASTTLAGTIAVPASIFNTTGALEIASRDGGTHAFHGSIDDLRIYSRALSYADIAALTAYPYDLAPQICL